MHLKSIRIKNFRSYRDDLVVTDIPDISILIGRNNAGKSNFIRALDWYRRMEHGANMSTRYVHTGNKTSPLEYEIEFALDTAERDSLLAPLHFRSDDITREMKASKLLTGLKHHLRFEGGGSLIDEAISIRNYSGDWLAVWGCSRGDHPNQVNTAFWQHDIVGAAQQLPKAGNFETFYPRGGSYNHRDRAFAWENMSPPLSTLATLLRSYLQRVLWIPPHRQAAAQINLGQEATISPSGDNLLRVLNTIQSEDSQLYDTLTKEIYDIIPDLKRIRTPPRGNNVVAIINEPGGVEIELDEAGSGLQQTLILVNHLLLRPTNSLLLVEEPEINLNASAQRALFRLMKRILDRGHQFIITTHSTIFTETSDKVATYLLDKKDGVSTFRRLIEPTELRMLKQALGHENTDLFGFNAVLIVEGDTEEKCLPLLAPALGLDLVKLGIRIVNIGRAGASARIDKLLEYLKESDTVPFVMLDNHSTAAKSKDKWIADKIVKPDNIFILDKEFEDCFDDELLASAAAAAAKTHGLNVSISGSGIASYRSSGKAVSSYLERVYFEQTGHPLSKPELGLAIGELLAKLKQRDKLTLPEEVLKTIQEQLGLRQ